MRIISDNPIYTPDERSAGAVNVVERIVSPHFLDPDEPQA